ncbi:MAG: hypothetical protein ACOCWQ_00865, partial [Nanoarchaeota archaeon]
VAKLRGADAYTKAYRETLDQMGKDAYQLTFDRQAGRLLQGKRITDAGQTALSKTGVATDLLKRASSRGSKYYIAYQVGVYLSLMDSIEEKYAPIGANALGIKKPYEGQFVSGSEFDALEEDVSKYFLFLVKDEFKGGVFTKMWQDQAKQRFYLASPCEDIHLYLYKGEAKCVREAYEKDEHGNEISALEKPAAGSEAAKVYGRSLFALSSLDTDYPPTDPKRYENAIKVCVDKNEELFEPATVGVVDAVYINPVPIGDRFGTFCYGGTEYYSTTGRVGVFVISVAASVVVDTLSAALAGTGIGAPAAAAFNYAANIVIDVAATYFDNQIAKSQSWPNHSSIDQTELKTAEAIAG